jgi:hypothetical protein
MIISDRLRAKEKYLEIADWRLVRRSASEKQQRDLCADL